MEKNLSCAVCGGESSLLDVVDLNKSCEEANGTFLGLSGTPVYYAVCGNCGFCFTPALLDWAPQQFKEKIYNEEYAMVDPDYVETRPRENASMLISAFGDRAHMFTHLDYGGGNGLLAKLLVEANFKSVSYDPFLDKGAGVEQLGKFDLITAFEVFEHVQDVRQLMSNLCSLLAPDGIILFSTLLSDGNIHPKQRLSWWYASPRNGHISLFSRQSLFTLAQQKSFKFGSFSEDLHVFFTNVPPWADHIIQNQR